MQTGVNVTALTSTGGTRVQELALTCSHAVLQASDLCTSHVSWALSAANGDGSKLMQARCILGGRTEAKTRREGTHAYRDTYGTAFGAISVALSTPCLFSFSQQRTQEQRAKCTRSVLLLALDLPFRSNNTGGRRIKRAARGAPSARQQCSLGRSCSCMLLDPEAVPQYDSRSLHNGWCHELFLTAAVAARTRCGSWRC